MLRRIAIAVALALACVPASAQQNRNTIIVTPNTITTGGTFQTVIPAGGKYSVTIQNNNTNGDNCFVYIGPNGNASQATSILLGQGGSYQRYYPYVPSDNISMTCATTNDTFYADYQ